MIASMLTVDLNLLVALGISFFFVNTVTTIKYFYTSTSDSNYLTTRICV